MGHGVLGAHCLRYLVDVVVITTQRGTQKFHAFLAALIGLCKEHGVQLSASGYDTLQVWDLYGSDQPIYSNIADCTRRTEL